MDAGFVDIEIADDHAVGDGLWSAFVRARRPETVAPRTPPVLDLHDDRDL